MKQTICKSKRLHQLRELMTRSAPTDEHKKAYDEFDQVLMYRANLGFIVLCA